MPLRDYVLTRFGRHVGSFVVSLGSSDVLGRIGARGEIMRLDTDVLGLAHTIVSMVNAP
jgi:hypothetical protein